MGHRLLGCTTSHPYEALVSQSIFPTIGLQNQLLNFAIKSETYQLGWSSPTTAKFGTSFVTTEPALRLLLSQSGDNSA